jgi:DNA-binding GntR family transcriptional regulator
MSDEAVGLEPNKTEAAFRRLREDILTARLTPGAPLRLSKLTRETGFGWTPLREALSRLEAEGLARAEPNRGFFVAPVSAQELVDLARARLALEAPLLELAMAKGGPAWEEGVRAAHAALAARPLPDVDASHDATIAWEAAHAAFHVALLAGADAPWLTRLHGQVRDQMRRHHHHLAWLPLSDDALPREARADALAALAGAMALKPHTELMEAVLARDVMATRALLEAHVRLPARFFDAVANLRPEPARRRRGAKAEG